MGGCPSKQEPSIEDSEGKPHVQVDHIQYENLVLEGGGVKGIGLAGGAVELERLGILPAIKRFAGSSAGSAVAAALAIGYSAEEVVQIMRSTDFSQFHDDSFGVLLDAERFINKYGYCKGKYCTNWVTDIIENKTGNAGYTFAQLWADRKVELIITGTNLTHKRLELFSRKNSPNMAIALAVRISMSVPFFFVPVIYEDSIYIDGGTLNNYPIDVFGEGNPRTLGLKLMSSCEERTDQIDQTPNKINSVKDFATSLVDLLLLQIERLEIGASYWDRTISIDTGNISATDFNITDEQLKMLYNNGKTAVKNFFLKPSA